MIDVLRTRRSIRKYEKKAVDEKALEIMKEALLRCPSSRGINPWTFIFVGEPVLLDGLSRAKEHGSSFVRDAPLAIVVCGDESQSDVWVEDCSIASIVAHLTAHSLGLGSCWIQIRNRASSGERTAEEHIQELLGLPRNLKVESIVGVGYPAETRPPVPVGQLDYGKIRNNRYEGGR